MLTQLRTLDLALTPVCYSPRPFVEVVKSAVDVGIIWLPPNGCDVLLNLIVLRARLHVGVEHLVCLGRRDKTLSQEEINVLEGAEQHVIAMT